MGRHAGWIALHSGVSFGASDKDSFHHGEVCDQ
jgi:6-phosphofructokinase